MTVKANLFITTGFSSVRENIPAQLPDKPPYTAHLGNLSYDATVETVTEFFEGCEIVSVRIIEDREMQRPKGFGYVEFTELDGLKQALTLDGQSFQGRMIKIKVADPRTCIAVNSCDKSSYQFANTRMRSSWRQREPYGLEP